tara:strand:- start:558 stop:761 length:204 start_codon:yes stop_codon:yes gene_type:complete
MLAYELSMGGWQGHLAAYIGEFQELQSAEYAIATAQRTGRGLATMSAVLSYAGKPFTTMVMASIKVV